MQGKPLPKKYPEWLDKLFLRFTVIYKGKWTSGLEDDRILTLSKHEWFERLKKLDEEIIEETINAISEKYDWPPAISEFLQTAQAIERVKKTERDYAERQRQDRIEKLEKREPSEAVRKEIADMIKRLSGRTCIESPA
jgi:poly-D-alanine transfer protein DltD